MKKLSVRLLNCEHLDILLSLRDRNGQDIYIDRVYLEADDFLSKGIRLPNRDGFSENHPSNAPQIHPEFYCVLPDIFTKEAEKLVGTRFNYFRDRFDGFMIQSLDELFFLREQNYPLDNVIASERLYAYNSDAVSFLKELGLKHFTHPLEVTLKESRSVSYGSLETVVYGRAPLMVSAGCVHKNTAGCDKNKTNLILKDRKKMGFYVQNRCDYCYNVVYNSVPTMLMDETDHLHPDCGSVRIDFTVEDAGTIADIMRLYANIASDSDISPDTFGFSYTRGHYHKGMTTK